MRSLAILLALIPTTVEIAQNSMCYSTIKKKEVNPNSADVKCLATMVYGESRGETEAGQVAVAYTALNRAVKRTLCQVVLAPKQYSIFNNNPTLRSVALSPVLEPVKKNNIDQESWDKAVRVAHLVLSKTVPDPTNGSTHYLAPGLMKTKGYRYPLWSKQFKLTTVIDNHRFYKEV